MANSSYKRSGNKERSFSIELDSTSKRHLKFFMENELSYYNRIIDSVTVRLRAFPEEVVSMRDGYGKLWSAIAYSGMNLRDLIKKDVKNWPAAFSGSLPANLVENNRFVINEKKLMLFDAISQTGNIHPQMRTHIASEILSTILPQADQLVQSQKNALGTMKDPVHMLVPKYYPERRHIQLTKDLVKIVYNKEQQQSEITIPYTDRPLIVKDSNLSEEKYNIMVIRQQPNVSVTNQSPWQIDLMITSHKYLVDLTDQNVYLKKRQAA